MKISKIFYYLLGVLVLGFLIKEALGNGDFKVFLEAAKIVATRKSPYHVWIFVSQGDYCLYFYSPLLAIILIPFSYLPNVIPNFIWLLSNTYFLYRIWILLTKYIDIQKLSRKQVWWFLFLSILFCVRFILYNFGMIQMTIFLLWSALESLFLFKRNKFLLGGVLLSLVINIKILPILFVPYLIYRKEFKGVISTLFFSIIFLFLPVLFLGWSTNIHLLSEWWKVINPNNTEHLFESDIGLHSLTALIPALLTKTESVLPYSRNILNLDIITTTNILNTVRICLIFFTFYFLKWTPFKRVKSKYNEIYELSYIFLLMPLIFPHQQKYAFFLTYPAIFYILFFIIFGFHQRTGIIKKGKYYTIIILFLLSFIFMTLTTDGIIGRNLNLITQHFKIITYGAIILIIILTLCPPKLFEKNNNNLI